MATVKASSQLGGVAEIGELRWFSNAPNGDWMEANGAIVNQSNVPDFYAKNPYNFALKYGGTWTGMPTGNTNPHRLFQVGDKIAALLYNNSASKWSLLYYASSWLGTVGTWSFATYLSSATEIYCVSNSGANSLAMGAASTGQPYWRHGGASPDFNISWQQLTNLSVGAMDSNGFCCFMNGRWVIIGKPGSNLVAYTNTNADPAAGTWSAVFTTSVSNHAWSELIGGTLISWVFNSPWYEFRYTTDAVSWATWQPSIPAGASHNGTASVAFFNGKFFAAVGYNIGNKPYIAIYSGDAFATMALLTTLEYMTLYGRGHNLFVQGGFLCLAISVSASETANENTTNPILFSTDGATWRTNPVLLQDTSPHSSPTISRLVFDSGQNRAVGTYASGITQYHFLFTNPVNPATQCVIPAEQYRVTDTYRPFVKVK